MGKKGREQNKLENWEIGIVKAMIENGMEVDQDITAYFTRPSRSINHSRIGDIRKGRKHREIKAATRAELKRFLNDWPQIDPQTGLNLRADELLIKSREAILVAVQTYNNPKTYFRSEIFIVTAIIAWTYLLHAYFKKLGVEYHYTRVDDQGNQVPKTTAQGAIKHWELATCIDHAQCPLSAGTIKNLKVLIGIRHEIEHQMTSRIDSSIAAKLQACCFNYNRTLKDLFGEELGLDSELSFALQFSSFNPKATEELLRDKTLPAHVEAARAIIEDQMTLEEYNDPHYAFRVQFVRKQATKISQADDVVEFVAATDEIQQDEINRVLVKEMDRKKYRPGQVVALMQQQGYRRFNQHHHTVLRKALDANDLGKGYGVNTDSDGWRWYQRWVDAVKQHCEENREKYD